MTALVGASTLQSTCCTTSHITVQFIEYFFMWQWSSSGLDSRRSSLKKNCTGCDLSLNTLPFPRHHTVTAGPRSPRNSTASETGEEEREEEEGEVEKEGEAAWRSSCGCDAVVAHLSKNSLPDENVLPKQ